MHKFGERRACMLYMLIETSLSTKESLLFYTMLTSEKIQSLFYCVVARYTGSWIKGLKRTGIRDHSPGIWDRAKQCVVEQKWSIRKLSHREQRGRRPQRERHLKM